MERKAKNHRLELTQASSLTTLRSGASLRSTSKPQAYRMIEPLELDGCEQVREFVDKVFAGSGFNARRLAEACRLFGKMITEDATIALTLAGAMTPIGMSGPIISLIKKGFVDFIISTGANLYHDMHRPFDCPMFQGHFQADDNALAQMDIARIYDTFIEDSATLQATDTII
ncbi:MAG: deoxyhypusine synthase family protein, partial [Phycisphaerae bacterium]|nr:deoxyhypusine synthase family protein [Phycisphaerae bacterium]